MVRQSRRSRKNKRGGNYPEAPMAQQQQAPMEQQQQQAPMAQQQQAVMPQQQAPMAQQAAMPQQQQQDSSPGFFGSVTNFFGTSTDATGVPGAPEAEKPWYQVWGGRRRKKSRKSRKGRKSRKSRRYKK